MDRIRITGGVPLNGTIPISGAKNAALPLMIASLLTADRLTLKNVPNLADASLVDLYRFATLELTEDKAEGHAAWREKRKPTFRGR